MKKPKRRSPFYAQLVSIAKSKRARNVVFISFMVFAVIVMFLMDSYNTLRDVTMPTWSPIFEGWNNNFIAAIMDWVGIERYDVTAGAWLLFGCVMAVAFVFVFGNIIAPNFVKSRVEKNRDLFSTETKVRVFYSAIAWLIILVIAALIVLVFYLLGAFQYFHSNKLESSPFASLMMMLLIYLAVLIGVPLAILLVYTVIKLVFVIVGYLFGSAFYFLSDVKDAKKEEEEAAKKQAEEEAAAAGGGAGFLVAETDTIFPSLVAIDNANAEEKAPTVSEDITLDEFVKRFQSFAINKHQIYYELPLLRQFIAGLASSRLIILEGLSGTGKSMLPRMFKEFTGSDAFFMPVQATWRDKTDVLGFYSEFTKTFKATVFLEKLYAAAYSDKVNMMILDEMNLSRVEYYFADFLSVLEYPEEDWKIKAYLPFKDQILPKKLEDGFISIPNNTWFVGTANTDDSTYTITDKVCDRAIILNFEDRFARIESNHDSEATTVSSEYMLKLFDEAMNDQSKCLNEADLKKFNALCEYVKDKFEILFGNRIMVQIEKFVPVYVALGGTKEEALDFMFAKKILRKFEGKYEEYFKDELIALTAYINASYGKGVFKETERFIAKMTKRLV